MNKHERQLAELRAQPTAQQIKNAARYEWMRRTFIADDESWTDDVADAKTGEELDAAIDTALQAGKEKE